MVNMRPSFSNFLIKFVYYTYLLGLIFLIVSLIALPILFFTPMGYIWYLLRVVPMAGLVGVIPFSIVFGYISKVSGGYFLLNPYFYPVLILAIILQYSVVTRLKRMLELENKRVSSKFVNAIAFHHVAVALLLILDTIHFWYYNVIWYPKHYQTVVYKNFGALLSEAWPVIIPNIHGSVLNFVLAVIIWRWMKSG